MSISHWGVFPGCWACEYRSEKAFWYPLDFTSYCRYMYGSDNEP